MSARSRGSEGIPPSNSPVRVLSVKPGVPIVVRFLAGYLGLEVHYTAHGSEPCAGPEDCPSSKHRQPLIWKGYAPAEQWLTALNVWQPAVLELTESLEEQLRGRELRGEVWSLSRVGTGRKNDPIIGVFCERVPELGLSATFDIEPVLQRIFRVKKLRLGMANLLPAQLRLECVKAPPPNLPPELGRETTPEEEELKREEARKVWEQFRAKDRRRLEQEGTKHGQAEQNGQAEHNGQTR